MHVGVADRDVAIGERHQRQHRLEVVVDVTEIGGSAAE
jgi:hypothetical protein